MDKHKCRPIKVLLVKQSDQGLHCLLCNLYVLETLFHLRLLLSPLDYRYLLYLGMEPASSRRDTLLNALTMPAYMLNVHSKQLSHVWMVSYPNHTFPWQTSPNWLTRTQSSSINQLSHVGMVSYPNHTFPWQT